MIKMALIGQAAEHNYCNVKCGIMDQFASSMGRKNCAIFLDCKDLSYKHIPIKMDGCKLSLQIQTKNIPLHQVNITKEELNVKRDLKF